MSIQNEQNENRSESAPEQPKSVLRFVCPKCGCRDLRTKMLVARYPVATLDGIEVIAGTLEFEELHQREDPFEWWDDDNMDGWEFWCDKCGLVPDLAQYDAKETQEGQLVRWLLDNCPQDEDRPKIEDNHSTE